MYSIISVIILLLLAGCSTSEHRAHAPVTDINRAPAKYSGEHQVESGETLYSIAWRYNRDFAELARLNDISPPYHLREGEVLQLAAHVKHSPAATQAKPVKASQRHQETLPIAAVTGKTTWKWPTSGKIIQYFSAQNEQKGIDLAGHKGQAILAAAPGEVVYSGDGLRGYGKLIIIKHNDEFLSAYAHNSKLLVSEGAAVKGSQKIAEMGQTDAASAMLHFEIRRYGNPVDPLQFLPKRG